MENQICSVLLTMIVVYLVLIARPKFNPMLPDCYLAQADSVHENFEFTSVGPSGAIKKIIQFQEMHPGFYNLAFGDWDEATGELRDDTRSNNGDRDKVIATVAYTVSLFMRFHPRAIVLAKGTTSARTRLYQIGINVNWGMISQIYDIRGYIDEVWQPFEQGKTYEAFSLKNKL